MKILVLTNLYPPEHIGGYELICQTVVENLRTLGHKVVILTSDHRANAVPDESSRSGEFNSSESEAAVERLLSIHGLYGHPWRGIHRLAVLEKRNNQILRSALERHRPELVYVWNMGGLSKSLLLTLQAIGTPTVFYISDHWLVRGLASDVWLNWWNAKSGSRIRRMAWRACELSGLRDRWQRVAPTNPVQHLCFRRVYFCSRALRDWTVKAGRQVEHGAIIYCPVHPRYFAGAFEEPRPKLERVLYAGRLAEDKGVLTALRALTLLRGRLEPQLTLCGRGDASYVAGLKKFATEHKLIVEFTTASSEEMPAIYRRHDLLLFTSEWEEPFALTPLEAMACGLPVIGTTTGGSAELFRNRQNALTYAAGDPSDLATGIWSFANDRALRLRCAQTAYHEARERYAAPVIVRQIESYLEDTLRHWRPYDLPGFNALISCAS